MDEQVTTMTGQDDQAIQIKYCQPHYDELVFALVERQLDKDIAKTSEELIEKLVAGEMDPSLEASNAITSAALSTFGPESVLNAGGCPVCAFNNIITHVADHIAVKYRKTN